MRDSMAFCASLVVFLLFLGNGVNCEDPYRFITWKITYGDIYPLGVKQQGILINGQFPGPQIDAVTNENLIISVYNYLREPFLISWFHFFVSHALHEAP
ncbi:L-ASCORBATE OXIDASE-like protein [Salix viminalis]|uniref:L-ASCORBATE OXIDASE-like protein n=1 Tax=Salix viminalis TaxID=40686 RepID=A0A9Q0QHJ8_SALVM|nr:L-ASCORBATE OXIDASE-like protein [Salix viminalis]